MRQDNPGKQERAGRASNRLNVRTRTSLLIAACAVLLGMTSPARATPVALVTATAYTYAPGDVDTPQAPLRMSRGGRLLYSNADPLGYHSIVSYLTDAKGEPVFWAPWSGTTELNEVRGVDGLEPGRYGFFCDVHGTVMEGILEVTPSIT